MGLVPPARGSVRAQAQSPETGQTPGGAAGSRGVVLSAGLIRSLAAPATEPVRESLRQADFGLGAAFHNFLEGSLPGSWWLLEPWQTDRPLLTLRMDGSLRAGAFHSPRTSPPPAHRSAAAPSPLASWGAVRGQTAQLCPSRAGTSCSGPDPRASSALRGPHSGLVPEVSAKRAPGCRGGAGGKPPQVEFSALFAAERNGSLPRGKPERHQQQRLSPKCAGCGGAPLGGL